MTAIVWMVLLAWLVNGLLLLALPVLSRPNIFFSVTVPEHFRSTQLAQSTLRGYRIVVALGSALAMVVILSASPAPWRVSGPMIQGLIGIAAWVWARQRIRPHGIASPVRVATLVRRELQLPGGWVAATGPFVILAAAGLLLYLKWNEVPERFPTSWSASGTPNNWRTKSVGSVYGTVLLGFAVTGLTLLQTVFILGRTRQVAADGPAAESEIQFKRKNALYGIFSMYLMAVLFSYFATRKLGASSHVLGLEVWAFIGIIVVGAGLMTLWMIRSGQGGWRGGGELPVGDATPDAAWKAGLIYFNPADSAVIVEKRMGFGWTLNFGNWRAWVLIAGLFIPVMIVLLTR